MSADSEPSVDSGEPSQAVQEPALACLRAFGYSPGQGSTPNDLRFVVLAASGRRYRAQWLLSPGEGVIRLVVHLDARYPKHRMPLVGEVVQRLDCEIGVLGGLGLDWNTGGIFFRYGVDVRGRNVCVTDYERMLNSAAFAISVCEKAVPFLSRGKASASAIVGTALALSDVESNGYLTPEAKKLFIQLVH